MQKWELFKEVLKNTETSDQYNAIITAVENGSVAGGKK